MIDDNSNKKDNSFVSLCGNGCCVTANFLKIDKKVIVSDKGQSVTFSEAEIIEFVKELLQRGYLD